MSRFNQVDKYFKEEKWKKKKHLKCEITIQFQKFMFSYLSLDEVTKSIGQKGRLGVWT